MVRGGYGTTYWGAHHGEGFAAARLAVGKDTSVVALKGAVDHFGAQVIVNHLL